MVSTMPRRILRVDLWGGCTAAGTQQTLLEVSILSYLLPFMLLLSYTAGVDLSLARAGARTQHISSYMCMHLMFNVSLSAKC